MSKAPFRRTTPAGDVLRFFGGLQKFFEFICSDTLFCVGAPFDAGCADGPSIQVTALLARGLGLVAPDLDLLAALLAPNVFRLRRPYFCASWTTFFKHDHTLHDSHYAGYDLHHTFYEFNS